MNENELWTFYLFYFVSNEFVRVISILIFSFRFFFADAHLAESFLCWLVGAVGNELGKGYESGPGKEWKIAVYNMQIEINFCLFWMTCNDFSHRARFVRADVLFDVQWLLLTLMLRRYLAG